MSDPKWAAGYQPTREEVWKYIGIPEEMHPMCALLGLIVRVGGEYKTVKLYIPYPSNPSMSVIQQLPLGDENEERDAEYWHHIFTVMVESMEKNRGS